MSRYSVIVLSVLLMMLGNGSAAVEQDAPSPDKRLLVKFSEQELKAMDQETLEFWNFYLDHAFEIVDIPEGKEEGIPLKLEMDPESAEKLEVLTLGVEPHEYVRSYYKLKETNKMLLLYSIRDIKRLMNDNE